MIQTSFHQLVWATKRFRRGELWRATDDLNCYMKRQLLRLLEWEAVAAGRGPVYPEGRRFEHWARAEAVRALAPAYAAYDPDSVAGAIRGARLEVVEGAGHTLYDPGVRDAVMRAIADMASRTDN